ncbi:MAG: ABC transporter permease [Gemmatimonadales bacterium]|nr:ABC transporter permease [Gemmatimonadales bacterium]
MPPPPPTHADPPVLVIRPDSARTLGLAGDLWAFRDLLWSLADRDLRLRYRQTALGVAWVLLQPVLGALIFTFVFGVVAGLPSDGVPYFLFTFASLAGWALFAGILTRASGSLVQNSPLIAKVWFPRAVLPASTLPAALIDFLIALLLLGGMMAWAEVAPGMAILAVPLWVLALAMLALGLGLIGSALMVSYRDVQHILPVGVQLLLYASPVAYSASNVPERFLALYYLNPLAPLLEGLRASLLGTPMPPTNTIVWGATVALGTFVLGAAVFRRLERRFADVI